MRKGENGNYKNKGFCASEIYYAMTGTSPEVLYMVDGKPVYRIDHLDEVAQELILDGLSKSYEDRLQKLEKFHAEEKRLNDERYQNYIVYAEQKHKQCHLNF